MIDTEVFKKFFILWAVVSVSSLSLGYWLGGIDCRNEYAQTFPQVDNFHRKGEEPLIGDIFIYPANAQPCIHYPCAKMYDGKAWVSLVPKSECK